MLNNNNMNNYNFINNNLNSNMMMNMNNNFNLNNNLNPNNFNANSGYNGNFSQNDSGIFNNSNNLNSNGMNNFNSGSGLNNFNMNNMNQNITNLNNLNMNLANNNVNNNFNQNSMNNFKNNGFDSQGFNIMLNNFSIKDNEDEEWMKGFKMAVEEFNNMENSKSRDYNVTFKTSNGITTYIKVESETTLSHLIEIYFERINRKYLIRNNEIDFIYNAMKILYENNNTPVENFFKITFNPTIMVLDPQNLIKEK